MTTQTAAAPGSGAPDPEKREVSGGSSANGHAPTASPAAHYPRSPGWPAVSSLSGSVIASTVLEVSSLGGGPHAPRRDAPPAAGLEPIRDRATIIAGSVETRETRGLSTPADLAEPPTLREPAGLAHTELDDAPQLETAGSGGAQAPPGDPKKGKGGRPKKDPEGRMALRAHLVELRKRVVRAGIAILLGAIAGWFLYLPFIGYITEPLKSLQEARTGQVQINFSNVASSFDLQVKGAVWLGVIVSSPLWIYQLWAFITPGLTRKERRYAVGFVAAAVPLFLAGVVLASFFIPRAVEFFTSFTPVGGSNIIDAPTYIGFVLRTVLTFGLAFLLPVVLVALNFAGLLSGKAVLKAWRWVLVASLAFAAIATPTPNDITAMFILATPIVVLFALAIVIALLHDRRKAKKQAKTEANPEVPDDMASPL